VARYLRQQGELGGQDLFLGELNRDEALSLASRKEGPETDPTPLATSEEYEELRKVALACRKCALASTRTNVVFSDGHPRARLMVVGEAPGAQEDKTGLAFVGPAGKLLDLLLASVDLSRESSAYICNVLKCRPPGNRNPLPGEIQECTPFLRRQIEVIAPEAILAVGTFSAQFLTGKSLPLGRLRGDVYIYQGVPLVVTYHPAALLRNPGWTTATWDDFQLLRQVLDGA
jgi:DNA polymerase